MLDSCSHDLGADVYDKVKEQLGAISGEITVGDLKDRLEKNVAAKMDEGRVTRLIQPRVKEWAEANKALVLDAVNQSAGKLHPDELSGAAFQLDLNTADTLLGNVSIAFKPQEIMGQIDLVGTAMKIVSEVILNAIVFALSIVLPVLGSILAGLVLAFCKEAIVSAISNNRSRKLSATQFKRLYSQYSSDRDKNIGMMQPSIKQELDKAVRVQLGEKYEKLYTSLDGAVSRVFEIVTLTYFKSTEL